MARITSICDSVELEPRKQLASVLRDTDEALLLPEFHRSSESGAFKNVVMKLSGDNQFHDTTFFSPKWFSGVSIVQVPPEIAEPLLRNPTRRAELLQTLTTAIASETQSTDVDVGPQLDGDVNDRDQHPWVAGLDGPGSCVGLYSSTQSRTADILREGMQRRHMVYFLVCKAGGGVASQVFHSRLMGALAQNHSLNECLLEVSALPGAAALRRVSMAGERNRARILAIARPRECYSVCSGTRSVCAARRQRDPCLGGLQDANTRCNTWSVRSAKCHSYSCPPRMQTPARSSTSMCGFWYWHCLEYRIPGTIRAEH